MTAVASVMRMASPEDLQRVVELTASAYAPYTAAFGAPPLPVTEDYSVRIAKGEVWVCDVDGEVAGLIVIEILADHLDIFSVAVSPSFQGKGLGVRMMRWVEDHARGKGLPELRLFTNDRMTSNIALYEKLGYAETAREPNPHRKGWILVHMSKRLW